MECREGLPFENWSQSVVLTPRRTCQPRTVQDVVDIVREARAAGRKVHAFGAGWSFSDIMASRDDLVDTSQLRGILRLSQGHRAWKPSRTVTATTPGGSTPASFGPAELLPGALRDEVLASDRRFVWVRAGTTIKEIYQALHDDSDDVGIDRAGRRGAWALRTMGGASGQTLAGAISTGTHGGDFDVPPIADMVVAIHLVGPDGRLHWIERGGAGAITDRRKMLAMGVGTVAPSDLRYDDRWFDSVLVSIGALGIVCSYILEVREQYGISERVHQTTWNDVKPLLESGEIFTTTRYSRRDERRRWIQEHPAAPGRRPKAVGLFINPYRLSYDPSDPRYGDRRVILVTHAESSEWGPQRPIPARPCQLQQALTQNDLIRRFEHTSDPDGLRSIIDSLLDTLRDANGTDGYPVARSVLDTTNPDDRPPVLSLEVAVSTADDRHVRLIDHLLQIFDDTTEELKRRYGAVRFAGGLNLRYTRPTSAYLGMQHPLSSSPDERFCHIEIIVLREQWETGRPLWGPGSDYTQNDMENFTEVFTDRFERATAAFGARLHWGQLSRTGALDPHRYRELDSWLAVRAALTDEGRNHTFDNDFVIRHIPTWERVAGGGRDIAIGGSGPVHGPAAALATRRAVEYVIGTDEPARGNGGIWRRRDNETGWDSMGGYGARIAADPQGNWWIVNSRGEIWGPGGRKPGSARDIGIGADGSVFVLGTDEPHPGNGTIYRWDGRDWQRIGGYGTRIAVDPQGQWWIVNSRGEIWGPGGRKPGRGRDIGIGADGSVWIIGTDTPAPGNGGVYRWTGSSWRRVEGHGVAIAVAPDGKPWVVRANGEIWRLAY